MAAPGKCIRGTGCAVSSEPQSTSASSRLSTSNFSPVRAQNLVRENKELLSAIDQLRALRPEAAASGPWTAARRPPEALEAAAGAAASAFSSAPPETARGPRPAAPSPDAASSGGLLPNSQRSSEFASPVKVPPPDAHVTATTEVRSETGRRPGRRATLVLVRKDTTQPTFFGRSMS
jgi:hypothetical protein